MLNRILQSIRSALPSICIVCGQLAERDYCICDDCEHGLPKLDNCCRCCGIEIRGGITKDSCCTRCQINPPKFDSCIAAFPYLSPIDKLVADFKFTARFDIGYSLSRVLANTFNTYYAGTTKPSLLLPVPLHASRLRSRGFNQAGEISLVLSKYCGVPVSHRTLRKTRNTEPQTSMNSAAARRVNLRGAFVVNKPKSLAGVKHIALVDDVVTTMATSQTISRLLRKQQDCRIDVWCLARAIH